MENRRALAVARYLFGRAGELLLSLFTSLLWLGVDLISLTLLQENQTLWQQNGILPTLGQWIPHLLMGLVATLWSLWIHYWRPRASRLRFFVQLLPMAMLLGTALFWAYGIFVALSVYERSLYIVIPLVFCLEAFVTFFAIFLRQRDLFFYIRSKKVE